jgi:formylglycine-generating enzyme required for sulfatase activity
VRSGADRLPVNCIGWETAAELCDRRGGRLPSEAEWEHAASGRGLGWRYPWGDDGAECCGASLDRLAICLGSADYVEPVGSHPHEGCPWSGDVSRDGVLDLGGSLGEWLRDHFAPFGQQCWASAGIAYDPTCDEGLQARSLRGSDFTSGLASPVVARRSFDASGYWTTGMRCSYEDEP